MLKQPFYIVDVFAEKKYAGNQPAVFRQAADLSSFEMQSITQEMGFSEIAFILSTSRMRAASMSGSLPRRRRCHSPGIPH